MIPQSDVAEIGSIFAEIGQIFAEIGPILQETIEKLVDFLRDFRYRFPRRYHIDFRESISASCKSTSDRGINPG